MKGLFKPGGDLNKGCDSLKQSIKLFKKSNPGYSRGGPVRIF